jgi:hypothetical protein
MPKNKGKVMTAIMTQQYPVENTAARLASWSFFFAASLAGRRQQEKQEIRVAS